MIARALWPAGTSGVQSRRKIASGGDASVDMSTRCTAGSTWPTREGSDADAFGASSGSHRITANLLGKLLGLGEEYPRLAERQPAVT